ncbi:MAG: DHCW motif cupin fold protein [Bacteroidales bacterium]
MIIPFQITDWDKIPGVVHPGEKGEAIWKTLQYEGLRIRMVEYTAGYLADHWCTKGHIIYCIEGEMTSHLSDGTRQTLCAGMTYQVTDDASSHKSQTETGVRLLIIDGDFLKP